MNDYRYYMSFSKRVKLSFFFDLFVGLVRGVLYSLFSLQSDLIMIRERRVVLRRMRTRHRIGKWCFLGRNSVLDFRWSKSVLIGRRFTIKDNSIISSRGDYNKNSGSFLCGHNVGFSENAKIYIRGDISIGSDSIFGPNVTIVSDEHFISSQDDLFRLNSRPLKTIIGENVWVGANVVILGNTEIGSNSIVAANSVVVGKIPANQVWGGVPAKFIKLI